jgi:hypothetical protein
MAVTLTLEIPQDLAACSGRPKEIYLVLHLRPWRSRSIARTVFPMHSFGDCWTSHDLKPIGS